jgi:hypothetical protein
MAAAWTFSRKDGVEATSRVVSVRSLDGRLVRCKFALRFHRAVPRDVAESAADEASMLLAEIIGEEIVQDELPFDGAELVHRVRTRSGNRDNRVAAYNVSELDLVPDPSKAARSSGGMQAAARKTPSTPPPPARPSGFIPVGRPSVPSSAVPTQKSGMPPSNGARAHTLWATALASCPPGTGTDRIGRLLSAPLRDSVAQLVLRGSIALEPASVDRLALLRDRNMDRPLSLVITAAGACLGAALYRVLVSASIPQKEALEIVEMASREALGADAADADTLGRYMSSDAPLKDLSRRAAAAIGSSDDAPRIFESLSSYAEVLRSDFGEAVRHIHRIRT